MPRVAVITTDAPDPVLLTEAVSILRAGGLVAVPTETVYGLAGRAFDEAALARIFEAKGRPTTHPLIAHVEGEAQARTLAGQWPALASELAARFFPGPLTLVLPRSDRVPLALTAGGDTVAIRAPAHPVIRALLAALGEPLAAPSANRYQSVSPTQAAHVVRSLGDRVDLVLDAGPTEHGIESTVVDLTTSPPRLLRPGALPISALRAAIPDLVVAEDLRVAEGEAPRSPGMAPRHYAPQASLDIVAPRDAAVLRARALAGAGKRVYLIVRGEPHFDLPGVTVLALGADPATYGAELFAAFHAADEAQADALVVEAVPDGEEWLAVRDWLRRARA